MQRIFILLSIMALTVSCGINDDYDGKKFRVEFVAIDSVKIPEVFIQGRTYPIKAIYNKPTDCHSIDGFYYQANGFTRTVALQAIVVENDDCKTLNDDPEETFFNFIVGNNSSYLFKFYKGEDNEGNPVFLEVEVPVKNN